MATGYLSTAGLFIQYFNDSGAVLSGGKVNTYVAGSTTPVTTYTDSTLTVANANPIILNSNGRLPASIWVPSGNTIKIVLTDSNNNTLATVDNLPSVNDILAGSVIEWVSGTTPTYVSATQFTVSGDQRTTFDTGRRVRLTISGNFSYASVSAQSYSASTQLTTVTIGSSVLTSGLTAVDYGIISVTNTSLPTLFLNALTFSGGVTLTDTSDTSKKATFVLSSISTSTTRNYTLPDVSSTFLMQSDVASQTDMQTPSSTVKYVSPGRQHFHPGHPKAMVRTTRVGGAHTIQKSYNITSLTDPSQGRTTFTFINSFADTNYMFACGSNEAASCTYGSTSENTGSHQIGSFTASSGANADVAFSVVWLGSMP